MAVAVEYELVEVPVDLTALLHRVVRSQECVHRMRICSVYSYFFKDRELGTLASLGKCLDLFSSFELLIEEIAGWKSQNLETLSLVIVVQFDQASVVSVCVTSFTSYIDNDDAFFALQKLAKVYIIAVDVGSVQLEQATGTGMHRFNARLEYAAAHKKTYFINSALC